MLVCCRGRKLADADAWQPICGEPLGDDIVRVLAAPCKPQARRDKPRVSAFTSANIDKILALQPDLVLTFSNLQADIVADLIRRGIEVHAFNQRTVTGILDMIRMLGAMVGVSERAEELVGTLEIRLAEARKMAACLPKRPGYSSRSGTIR